MHTKRTIAALACSMVLGVIVCASHAQQGGLAERAGETLDDVGRGIRRGTQEVTEAVRKRFDVMRTEVGRMGIHSRIYSRLHWDKALYTSNIEVHILKDGAVLLRGTVPDAAAKKHAVDLASETVDVTTVIDELAPLTTATIRPVGRPR
jgi:hyperosmotically inducible protein